jgi:hypothetical protein
MFTAGDAYRIQPYQGSPDDEPGNIIFAVYDWRVVRYFIIVPGNYYPENSLENQLTFRGKDA